jgi:hypothetical protein
MKFSKLVLKYKESKPNDSEKYVATDSYSGGCPYPVDALNAEHWPDKTTAENYSLAFPGKFELIRLDFVVTEHGL